jgi:ATP phosphoribosyltransferase
VEKITIALTKGRILKDTLPLFAEAGIEPVEDIAESRKLIFDTTLAHVQFVVIRGTDVPTYVQLGAADIGVAGKDVLLEHGASGMYELLDLGISRCRLMTATMRDRELPEGKIKVATKFVNVARRYFAAQGTQVEMIKLYGAMELAPLMNLADVIVDIVDTGNTLRANGMAPVDTIATISSRLVVNSSAMKRKHQAISDVVERLRKAVEAREAVNA